MDYGDKYGRRMYEVMVGCWPAMDMNPSTPASEAEYAQIWRNMPKIVFSTTLAQVDENARLVRENIAEEVLKLKGQAGKNMVIGGADLAATFMRLGPIDESWLYVHPVILGSGKPMFPALDNPIDLRLVESHRFGSGVVHLRFRGADAA